MKESQEQLIKQSLAAVKALKARVAELESGMAPAIAIVGCGCRFAGGIDSTRALYQALSQGQDLVGKMPAELWAEAPDSLRHGAFLRQPEGLDAAFFRIAPCEARSLDPQQRLLLELSWEALENAAFDSTRLEGSRTGVFTGLCGQDYYRLLASRPTSEFDSYMLSGTSHSTAAGRISFVLGLHGPALALDTACSSSLAAVHVACRSLRSGECDLALAGGVNRILTSDYSLSLQQSGMLSPRGRCSAFDADADGFVRGEGGAMLVLQRLQDAQKEGRPVLAVIRGSAMNHDGRTSGLTVPNGPAQQRLIQEALRDARVQPEEVTYVESHGTGTALGDPIELNALKNAYASVPRANPLAVGSVKTNLGHTEAAAGAAGLLKAILCLHHKQLFASLHHRRPTPHFDWSDSCLRVPTASEAWETVCGRRLAGVSSFGFSGTNVHMILEEAPPLTAPSATTETGKPLVLPLSAASREALLELVEAYRGFLETSPAAWSDIVYTAQNGRTHLRWRTAVVAFSKAEARIALENPRLSLSGEADSRAVDTRGLGSVELAAHYLEGVRLEWSSQGHFVELPGYPWQRETFWFTSPSEDHFESVLRAGAATVSSGDPHFAARLDRWVRHRVALTLRELNPELTPGGHFAALQRALTELARLDPDPSLSMEGLAQEAPAAECIVRLVDRCLASLGPVLGGQQNPLELLFAEDGVSLPDFYRQAEGLTRLNQRLAAAVQQALPAERPAAILEVGGGTGSTTSHLLEVLPPDRYHYLFTDLGRHLVAEAEARFARWPVECRHLNLETPLTEQGLPPAGYDMVVAANVLHATADLAATLERVRAVLKPGGWLFLLESTQPQAWVTVVSGMTEGWWSYQDTHLRKDSPLLSVAGWLELLRRHGFEQAAELPGRDAESELLAGQVVLVARLSGQAQAQAPAAPAPRAAASVAVESDFLDKLEKLPASARGPALQNFVATCVAQVLGHKGQIDPKIGFFDLGVDSLTSLALRNRLQREFQCNLSGSLTFSYPSVEKLCDYLRSDVLSRLFPLDSEAVDQRLKDLEGSLNW